jgi:putative endonuclease
MAGPSFSSDQSPSALPDTGSLGEALVCRWLTGQGWKVLCQRWRSRWGELDLVIGQPDPDGESLALIVFVEVKTRRDRNWDDDGRLAITARKQAKLWKTAQLFLAEHPELAHLPCRFDVALVSCERLIGAVDLTQVNGQTVAIASGHRLALCDYIQSAFTGDP